MIKFLLEELDLDLAITLIGVAAGTIKLFVDAGIPLSRFTKTVGKHLGPISFLIRMFKGIKENNNYRDDPKKFVRDLVNALINSFMPFAVWMMLEFLSADPDDEDFDLWDTVLTRWMSEPQVDDDVSDFIGDFVRRIRIFLPANPYVFTPFSIFLAP